MTPDEARQIAQEAADTAVATLFLHLGYDVHDKEQVRHLKRDLEHLRGWREATDTIRKQGVTAAVTVVVAGALGALWLGFQMMTRGGGQ